MDKDLKALLVFIGLVFLAFGILFFIALFFSSVSCHAQWDRSMKSVQWGIFSDCMIETPDGVWMPASNYHNVTVQQ